MPEEAEAATRLPVAADGRPQIHQHPCFIYRLIQDRLRKMLLI